VQKLADAVKANNLFDLMLLSQAIMRDFNLSICFDSTSAAATTPTAGSQAETRQE